MIGPEQDKKASGKSGKKKGKGKKAKRLAAELALAGPTGPADASPTAADAAQHVPFSGLAPSSEPQAEPEPVTDSTPDAAYDPGPSAADVGDDLLAWIDRVQARVDHLLTLVEPAPVAPEAETPQVETPEAETPQVETPEAETPEAATPETAPPEADADAAEPDPDPDTEPAAAGASLAEAWAQRQRVEEAAGADAGSFDDDEPFESGDARLTAVLVARELIARGERPADVRRRLREGYGVIDPDAVLAQVAA